MTHLKTNSILFDELLEGGFQPGTLTELFGVGGTGKTQLCHQLCINVQLPPEQGGLNGNAMFIDTQHTFRPERLLDMTTPFMDFLAPMAFLNGVHQVNAKSSKHLSSLIQDAEDFIAKTDTKLFVVDNFSSFYIEESATSDIPTNLLKRLTSDLQALERLTKKYPELIIIYTTHFDDDLNFFLKDPNQKVEDKILSPATTTRINLKKGKGTRRIASVISSSYLPESKIVFQITENGINDI